MARVRKRNLLFIVVLTLFAGAYARHRYVIQGLDITGQLRDKELNEISGIAASGIFPNVLYIHNDSGDTSRFFSISPDGKLKSTIYFKGDPREKLGVHDCEDIAVGVGPAKGKSYVYLGDIGDNKAVRPYLTIYRMEESPDWAKGGLIKTTAVPLHLKYPDGPKDAETLMIDPVEDLIYIVSKRTDTVSVYTTPLIYKPGDTATMTRRCKLFFEGIKPLKWITAGDISRNGQQVLIKNYEKVYYWRREKGEHIWQTVQRKPRMLPYQAEKQGEAIGFTVDGKGYYTTSEGVFAPIYYYRVPQQ